MKTTFLTLGVLLASASATVSFPAHADPDQPPPAELRERAEQLEEKVRDLKAAGRHDEAQQLLRELKELRSQPAIYREADELEARRAELRSKLEALRAEGRERDAAEVKERLVQREREPERPGQARMERPRPGPPGTPGPVPRDREGIERRMHHFELAIENLHAAGLPDIAERLARERERVAQRLRAGPERNAAVEEELGRLRAELNELHGAIQGLKARVEELHRDEVRR